MFITRLNRLFSKHGRVAFAILTVMIIIPFVLYFSSGVNFSDIVRPQGAKSHVTIYGKTLTLAELNDYTDDALLSFFLKWGQQVDFRSDRAREYILPQALERVRALRAAGESRVCVSDREIAEKIRSVSLFQTDGKFDSAKFNNIVAYYLQGFGFTKGRLDMVVADDLKIEKLEKQITGSVVASEAETFDFYRAENETVTIQVAEFNSADYLKSVTLDEKALRAFFAAHQSQYEIPAKFQASVVRFNFIDYDKEAEKALTADAVKAYYEANKESKYRDRQVKPLKAVESDIRAAIVAERAKDTSGKKKDAAITDKDIKAYYEKNSWKYAEMTIKPLDKVEKEVKEELRKIEREKLAMAQAQRFAVDVYRRVDAAPETKPTAIFAKFSAEDKRSLVETGWIEANTEDIKNIGKEPELSAAIANLFMEQPISNAVRGNRAVFVCCLTAKQNSRPATFEEVTAKVKTDAEKDKAVTLAREKARMAVAGIMKALEQKTPFDKAKADVAFKKSQEFSAKAFPREVVDPYQVKEVALKTPAGQVSAVTETAEGAFVVYTEKRQFPSFEDFKKRLDAETKAYLAKKQRAAWQNYTALLKERSGTIIVETKTDKPAM